MFVSFVNISDDNFHHLSHWWGKEQLFSWYLKVQALPYRKVDWESHWDETGIQIIPPGFLVGIPVTSWLVSLGSWLSHTTGILVLPGIWIGILVSSQQDHGPIPLGSWSPPGGILVSSQSTYSLFVHSIARWQQEYFDDIKLKNTVLREKPCNLAAASPTGRKKMIKKTIIFIHVNKVQDTWLKNNTYDNKVF